MANELRELNPMSDRNEGEWIHCQISRKTYDYFIRQLFPGERGPRQHLICIFFAKLERACKDAGLTSWDTTTEQRVANIVSKLNFNSGPERPVRTRRSNKSAIKSPKQSAPSPGDGGGTPSVGPEAPNTGDVSPDTVV